MRINADFDQPVVLPYDPDAWIDSPMPGVERLMLDRVGGEVARATSLVRYAPGSTFSEHVHSGGEEYLVLKGTFSDTYGDQPAGTYVRNPIGTKHAPWSEPGAVIFVKLHQFEKEDDRQVALPTESGWSASEWPDVEILLLHRYGPETVSLYRLAAGAAISEMQLPGGAEFLVVEGTMLSPDDRGVLKPWSWLRQPAGSAITLRTETGCVLYCKTGHLPPQAFPA